MEHNEYDDESDVNSRSEYGIEQARLDAQMEDTMSSELSDTKCMEEFFHEFSYNESNKYDDENGEIIRSEFIENTEYEIGSESMASSEYDDKHEIGSESMASIESSNEIEQLESSEPTKFYEDLEDTMSSDLSDTSVLNDKTVRSDSMKRPTEKQQKKKKEKLHLCHLCPSTFQRPFHLREHLQTHQEKRTRNFECDQCDKKFYYKSTLAKHALDHDPNHQSQHVCDECGHVFRTKGNLTIHQRLHAKSRDFVCIICHKGYVRRSDLRLHMERAHSGHVYKCTQCDKEYVQETSYKNHMRTHEGHLYQCDVCDKSYKTRPSYLEHKLTHEQLKMPFQCGICDKRFVRRYQMRRHVRGVHKIDGVEEIDSYIIQNPKQPRIRGSKTDAVQSL